MAAVIAIIFVVLTFGWIVIDSVRSARRHRVFMEQRAVCSSDLDRRLKSIEVKEVEERVLVNMRKISAAYPPHPAHLENTPPEMDAVNPGLDETRFTQAIREKTEEISKSSIKKMKS